MSGNFDKSFAIENDSGLFINLVGEGPVAPYAALLETRQEWRALPPPEADLIFAVVFQNEETGLYLSYETEGPFKPILGTPIRVPWGVKPHSPGYFRLRTMDKRFEIGVQDIHMESGPGSPLRKALVLLPAGQGENFKLSGLLGVPVPELPIQPE